MLELLVINVYIACQTTCGIVDAKALKASEAYIEQLAPEIDVQFVQQDEKLYVRQGLSPSRIKDIGFSIRMQNKIEDDELFVVFTPRTMGYTGWADSELIGLQLGHTYGGFYVKNHREEAQTLTHELLHMLGFMHNDADITDIMHPNSTCTDYQKPYDFSPCKFQPVLGPGLIELMDKQGQLDFSKKQDLHSHDH